MSSLSKVAADDPARTLPSLELLEARIHDRTGGRLQYLKIHKIGEQVCVSGAAPSYHVRQLAEHAALSLVARERLQLEIDVLSILHWYEPEFQHRTGRFTPRACSEKLAAD